MEKYDYSPRAHLALSYNTGHSGAISWLEAGGEGVKFIPFSYMFVANYFKFVNTEPARSTFYWGSNKSISPSRNDEIGKY